MTRFNAGETQSCGSLSSDCTDAGSAEGNPVTVITVSIDELDSGRPHFRVSIDEWPGNRPGACG
jgi:hypothetical protein